MSNTSPSRLVNGGSPGVTVNSQISVNSSVSSGELRSVGGVNTAMVAAAMNETNPNNSNNVSEDNKAGILGFEVFDHMYASMTDEEAALGVSPLRGSEVNEEARHLKELLLLHLDLIQQQSEQIATKDKLLTALRQENETVGKIFYSRLFSFIYFNYIQFCFYFLTSYVQKL